MLRSKILKYKAFAKINLFLNVFNKTKDNLHKLNSLVCFIDLYDEIEISESKRLSIEVKGPFKHLIKKNNIVEKTIIKFSNFINTNKKYKILLTKKIPVAAGLGGGSADAAAVLQGLNYLNKNQVSKKNLFRMAMEIGSDVPACLYNKNVFFSGYGQILSKAPKIPKFYILLINPRKELSTKKVFNNYKKKKIIRNKNNSFRKKNFISWMLKQKNDLQIYSQKFVPEIKEMLNFLKCSNNCLVSNMTGSGPTVYGIFENKKNAKKINLLLRKNHPKWWSGVYSIKT